MSPSKKTKVKEFFQIKGERKDMKNNATCDPEIDTGLGEKKS